LNISATPAFDVRTPLARTWRFFSLVSHLPLFLSLLHQLNSILRVLRLAKCINVADNGAGVCQPDPLTTGFEGFEGGRLPGSL
jgi:hypothetical protein